MLAAANPLYGRFRTNLSRDPHQNVLKNVNLPAALLSRFDVMFLIIDRVDSDRDLALAKHVTYVHQNEVPPPLEFDPLSPAFMRAYISQARRIDPVVPPALASFIAEAYVEMRAREHEASLKSASSGRGVLTARQLLSILRMAQARARLRFSLEVSEEDVREAIRLVNASTASISAPDDDDLSGAKDRDFMSRIFSILRDMYVAKARGGSAAASASDSSAAIRMAELEERVTRAGFSREQLEATLADYAENNVIMVNPSRTLVDFVAA